jgi:hypothetical protein
MVVSQDADTGAFEVYVLTGDSVEHIGKDNTRKTIGTITQGNFVPKSEAQAGIYIGGNNYGNINQYNYYGGGGRCGGYGGYCYYRPRVICRPCW